MQRPTFSILIFLFLAWAAALTHGAPAGPMKPPVQITTYSLTPSNTLVKTKAPQGLAKTATKPLRKFHKYLKTTFEWYRRLGEKLKDKMELFKKWHKSKTKGILPWFKDIFLRRIKYLEGLGTKSTP